jgi:hypothetical protein
MSQNLILPQPYHCNADHGHDYATVRISPLRWSLVLLRAALGSASIALCALLANRNIRPLEKQLGTLRNMGLVGISLLGGRSSGGCAKCS